MHYQAIHLQPYYRDRYGFEPFDLPVATDISSRTLSLPLSPAVTESDQVDVSNALRSGLRGSL